MPEVIRHTAVLTAVVTISTVADQSTLNPVSPTVSATINGVAATITAYSWKVNGSVTGITGATTATPTYTPTTGGSKSITCDVTISGVVHTSTPEIFVVGPTSFSVAITAIDDVDGLETVNLIATPTGGVTPITYSWAVIAPDESSQTAVVANAAAASTTAALASSTGRKAGLWTFRCTATDAVGQVWPALAFAAVGKEVDTGAGSVWMYLVNTVDFTGEATADWTAADGAKTLDGVSFLSAQGAGGTTFGPVLGQGIRFQPADNKVINSTTRTAPYLTALMTALISGWTFGTSFALQWIYNKATPPADPGGGIRAWIGTEAGSSVAATQDEVVLYDNWNTGALGYQTNVRHGATIGGYSAAAPLADSGMEILCDGSGCTFGLAATDPGATPPAPGSFPRGLVSATALDYGPVAWEDRVPASTGPVTATCCAGFGATRATGQTAVDVYLERLHVWLAA